MSRAVVHAALLAITLVAPGRATADAGRTFANEIACGKAPGLTAGDCRRAFALAHAEYLAKARGTPSRFACYRAYGPCSPWPASGGPAALFRPQLMGVTVGGTAPALTAQPVVAPGKVRLAFAIHPLSDPMPAVATTAPSGSAPMTLLAGGPAVSEALCRQIADGAAKAHLPPAFLARLLWQESSFRTHVVSPAGALGIAQFMPGTALERGLDDPFDPGRAIATSAALLADLARRFGNLGLAAAAYNGGPARLTGWLAGRRSLPTETESYVSRITGRSVEDWAHTEQTTLPDLEGPCATLRASRSR